ncbi:MAG TPA: sensor histidine kinase [Candidatus Babeliaceae bacterium]|nr:sensor histidine kinase [Candidatus Babeliaceae bacterium]
MGINTYFTGNYCCTFNEMSNCKKIYFFSGILRLLFCPGIIIAILIWPIHVFSQNIDNRKSIDTANISYQAKVDQNLLTADSAISLYKKIVRQSMDIRYPDGIFDALMQMAILYREKDDYQQTKVILQQALGWAPEVKRTDAFAWCYNNLGDLYESQGNYTEGASYYYKALNAIRKVNSHSITEANIIINLGDLYEHLNQPQKAFTFFNEAERICIAGHYDYQLAAVYLNKGKYYLDVGQIDSSKQNFIQALSIAKKLNMMDLISVANVNIGAALIAAGEYGKALPYLRTAINLSKANYHELVLDASCTLGDALRHMHRYSEAEAILVTALKETKSVNTRDNYVKCYSQLIEVYKATGQYKKAMDCMDSVAVLKDSMMGAENAKAISQMEFKYQTSEKDKELAQNQLLIAKQKNKLAQKNMLIVSVVPGIILLSLLLWLRYKNSRNKQYLQAEQIKRLQYENTISVLKGIVQGEENERGRIARELHDGIGGMLSAAMMRFATIRHANETIVKISAYREAMTMLDEIGEEIRKTAHNLMPTVLLKQSLPDAVRSYCNSVQEEGKLQINFQCYGEFGQFSQDLKLNVYRIIQELLKNIVAHACATRALVQLTVNENVLALTVEDNGLGFTKNESAHGIGIHNLTTRVSGLHGHYTIESEQGQGTSIFIEFDLAMLPKNNAYENQDSHS